MVPLLRLWTTSALIAMEAQAVIAMRLWGMAGLWHVTANENRRMVEEKLQAAQNGIVAASHAAPVRRKTRSNVTRLQKGNPLLPGRKGR